MKRLGTVLHHLVTTEAITVAEADRVWEAVLGDLRDVEVVSQGTSTGRLRTRAGGALGELARWPQRLGHVGAEVS